MMHIPWTTLALPAIVLAMAGCAPVDTPPPLPTIALETIGSSEVNNVRASAEIVPAQETYLSFMISGPISEVVVEKGDVVEAGQLLATLSSPDLEYGLLQAEAALRAEELDYEYWKLPRRVEGGEIVERGLVAKKELAVARRSVDTAQAELTQTKLIAPITATVTSIKAQPGEYVQPGQIVIVLAKLDNLKIETSDLSELNVAAVKVGQPATIYVEALDKEFEGVVTAISPISNSIGGDVVFKVTVRLNEPPLDLLWGMSADVEIQTKE